ncbi:ankyrin repeat-containing protein [Anaeramoeba flamelloides]|uniref:Ankyrin repeat-containing protein n=1 Tax=Anaeramoeba flamelloides TaxID=1746091 RepID=A0ABQ8Z6M8_9EUKA|nr:ankyrin repeat-containing protein [Anaeramoeba flamelloides]
MTLIRKIKQSIKKGSKENFKNQLNQFLEKGNGINQYFQNGKTLLIMATESGHLGIVNILLQQNADVNLLNTKTGQSPIIIAIKLKKMQIIELFLSKNPNLEIIDKHSNTALTLSIENKLIDVIPKLMKKNININYHLKTGDTPLSMAIKKGLFKIVKLFLQKVNPKEKINGYSYLSIAVEYNQTEIVEHFLSLDLNPNQPNDDGTFPLLIGCLAQSYESIAALLQSGADANQIEKENGWFPLFVSVMKSNNKITKLLIEHDADIQKKTSDGSTLLHLAVKNGKLKLIQLLINGGINVNIQNSDGITPLFLAVLSNRTEIVKFLLANQANANIRTKDKLLPIDLPTNPTIKELLSDKINNQNLENNFNNQSNIFDQNDQENVNITQTMKIKNDDQKNNQIDTKKQLKFLVINNKQLTTDLKKLKRIEMGLELLIQQQNTQINILSKNLKNK